jgi:lysophospholipase L1-like esterase
MMTTADVTLHEESDPFCLSPQAAATALAHAPWHRFVTVGDSLSAGTGGPSPGYTTLGWPDRVADILRRVHPDLEYLNLAEIGATTAQTLATQMDRMVEFGPDLVHLPSGANDLFGRELDFGEIEQTLQRMFERAAQTGAQLTTFTLGKAFVIPKYPDWHDRVRTVNAITRKLAVDYNAVLVDMWDHPINDRPNLLSADRIHFSMSGQAVMASAIVKALAVALNAMRPARNQWPGM